MAEPAPSFEAPEPGPWALDASHFDGPFGRFGRDWYAEGFTLGQAAAFEHAGWPVKTIRMAWINGLPYGQVVPLVGSPADTSLPPRWLFKILSRLHPALRRRSTRAREWLEGKGWRDDLRRWDDSVKPRLFARFETLGSVPIETLDDQALIAHIRDCGDALIDNLREHFLTNPATMVPVGTLLRETMAWTGCSPREVLELIGGTGATGHSEALLRDLAARLREAGDRTVIDGGGSAAELLETLCERDDPVGEAARRWLDHVGPRVVSSGDFSTPTGAEVPELLVEHLRHACAHAPAVERASPAEPGRVRARVPTAQRDRFDELLEEARLVYRLRDERSTLLDTWAMGLVRRALLAAGRRLVDRSALRESEHVVDLHHTEVESLLLHSKGPSPDEIADRGVRRAQIRIDEAPPVLGGEPTMPPLDYFPDHWARMLGALFCYREHMEDDAPAPEEPQTTLLKGFAASAGRYRGPARVINDSSRFGEFKPGEVLVARATMPNYNVLLPIAGAIVTDRGGALCHAAIVSREYGLPCVVGTREATRRIRNGDIVVVDGDNGTIEIES